MKGGKREGAGRPQGSGSRKPIRNVIKQVRWTEEEWKIIEHKASSNNVTPSDWIRLRSL